MAFRTSVVRLAAAKPAASTGLWGTLESWAANMSGFAKYGWLAGCLRVFQSQIQATYETGAHDHSGLRREDLIDEDIEVVKEALRRLPAKETEDRHFRFKRVCGCVYVYACWLRRCVSVLGFSHSPGHQPLPCVPVPAHRPADQAQRGLMMHVR